MPTVVREINAEYEAQIDTSIANISYDDLEMSGSRAVWQEVIAVYAVKTNTDPANAQEVATMDEGKKAILTDIFWQMNDISSRSETKTVTEMKKGTMGTAILLKRKARGPALISISPSLTRPLMKWHISMVLTTSRGNCFPSCWRREQLHVGAVLYGIGVEDDQIVTVAQSQVGNVGGDPYWSVVWFHSRVEWCASLCRGVLMSVVISIRALFRSMRGVSMALSGLKTVDNGRVTAMNPDRAILSSSIGTNRTAPPVLRTVYLITWVLWNESRTGLFIPWRETPEIAAE